MEFIVWRGTTSDFIAVFQNRSGAGLFMCHAPMNKRVMGECQDDILQFGHCTTDV